MTDEESRIMPVSGSGFEQCYNAQASVDTDTLLFVSTHVSQATNDKQEMTPALEALGDLSSIPGKVTDLLADAGYFSEGNVRACLKSSITPSIATGRDQHNRSVFERFAPDSPPPDTKDPVERMKHRISTKAGRKLYGLRKHTVEPVFGIIKHVMGFRAFSLRGIDKVAHEWTLATLAWNVKRMNVLQMA